jgi:AcrR family transcriptional regulator
VDVAAAEDREGTAERRCIRAAEELFKRFGFRAVTMEAVARGASVSKVTLYSYFKNKDELFLAVCKRMAKLLLGAVNRALREPKTPLDARLASAVIAKHEMVFALVRGSPHAAELFSSKDALAGDVFAELDLEILAALENAIAEHPAFAPRAGRLSRALYFGSADLAARCDGAAAMRDDVADFIAVHLAGARALGRKKSRS